MAYEHAFVLTGSIASGKSTVSRALQSAGFALIDADVIAKEQLELHAKELISIFGEDICEDGAIDRKKLAKIIFDNKEQRAKLNAFLHPLIRAEIQKRADALDKRAQPYILDIPLYFESGEYGCRSCGVVYTPEVLQLERLKKRDGIDTDAAQKRIDAQMSIEEKKKRANWVIDNSKDLEYLQIQIDKFINHIRGQYAYSKI